MLRIIIFVLSCALGAASYWGSKRVRATEDELLPWVAPGGRPAASIATPSSPSTDSEDSPKPSTGSSGWMVTQASHAQRMGGDGAWAEVAAGATLSEGDQLRTKGDGKLMVQDEPGSTVYLIGPGTLALHQSGGRTNIQCSEGRIVASPAQEDVAVELRQGGTLATSAASFAVLCGAQRSMVHATDGAVKLAQGGSVTDVPHGQLATVPSSGAPTTQKLSASVELKLDPVQVVKDSVVIAGQAAPGTRVAVGGTYASADDKGRFKLKAPLPEGDTLDVRAMDLAGRERTSEVSLPAGKKGKPVKKGKK